MIKCDFKNFASKRLLNNVKCSQTSLHSKIISTIGASMLIGMLFIETDSNATVSAPIIPTPTEVRYFEFSNEEYPGQSIPKSVDADYKKELGCMAKNIYFESRDQELKGQIAVGLVTFNRVHSKNFPNSICEVVWQKRWSKRYGKWIAQFSWTLDGKSDVPRESAAFQSAMRLSTALLAGGIEDFTKGADHYHAEYVNPSWAKKLTLVAQIDDHIFYQE